MTKTVLQSNENLQMRAQGFIPDDLGLKPSLPQNLTVGTHLQPTLTYLAGTRNGQAKTVNVTQENELVTAIHGTAFVTYTTKTGTAPGSYNLTDIVGGTIKFQRFDITVTSQPVTIRFVLDDGSDGDDIVVGVGFMSIAMASTRIQIKNNGTAGTYQIVGFR